MTDYCSWADITVSQYVAPPTSQIAYFANQGVNIFRIPFGWQYMESSPGAGLNSAFFSQYDAIIQATLKLRTHLSSSSICTTTVDGTQVSWEQMALL